MNDWIPVIVAVVGAGGPLVVLMTRFDRRNTAQHETNIRAQERTLNEVTAARRDIQRVEHRLDKQVERMDEHIGLHLDQALNAE
jgi:uncharacterized FlaG/YvyC family protein